MFEYKGIEWRDLKEQVEANKNNIINILNGGLTDTSGLSIKYSVPTVAELPQGEIGDGAIVGQEGQYSLYGFLKTPTSEATWLLISPSFPAKGEQGEQGIQGVQGEQGEQGEKGIRGSYWFTTNDRPSPTDLQLGDIWLTSNGDVYQNTQGGWEYKLNILGQQGVKGDSGIDGLTPYIQNGNWWIGNTDTGVQAQGKNATAVVIQPGIYTPTTVPNFASTDPLDGYIVRNATAYDLYIHAAGATEYTIVENWGGVPGIPGATGADGVSVTNVVAQKTDDTQADVVYTLTTTLSDGQTLESGNLNIPKGVQGEQGVSITNVSLTEVGQTSSQSKWSLTVSLSNGDVIDTGAFTIDKPKIENPLQGTSKWNYIVPFFENGFPSDQLFMVDRPCYMMVSLRQRPNVSDWYFYVRSIDTQRFSVGKSIEGYSKGFDQYHRDYILLQPNTKYRISYANIADYFIDSQCYICLVAYVPPEDLPNFTINVSVPTTRSMFNLRDNINQEFEIVDTKEIGIGDNSIWTGNIMVGSPRE